MKKLLFTVIALGGITAINQQAHADTGTTQVVVTNITPTPMYVAVYEEFEKQKPKLFGVVLPIKGNDTTVVYRPNWSFKQRRSGDRNLYFDTNEDNLKKGILGSNFVNIGERQGEAFTIYPVDREGKPSMGGTQFKAISDEEYKNDIVPKY